MLLRSSLLPVAIPLRMGRAMRASACQGGPATSQKAWRLSSSVIILAPYHSVPDCELTDPKTRDAKFDYRVCCVKRAARSTFMPDAMVFPGGAVDAADAGSAAQLLGSDGQDLQATLLCAAVREVFEESGVGLFQPPLSLDAARQTSWRQRLHADAAELRSLCREHQVLPSVGSLSYWCSFITPDMEHARLAKGGFDARFYVCCAEESQLRWAASDSKETVSLVWITPGEALSAVADGRISMVPPQWYILNELAESCSRMSEVTAYAASASRRLQREYPIKPYPVAIPSEERSALVKRHDASKAVSDSKNEGKTPPTFALCFPGDDAHPVFPGAQGARHRLLMVGALGGRMAYELCREPAPELPLREAQEGWYRLAKL